MRASLQIAKDFEGVENVPSVEIASSDLPEATKRVLERNGISNASELAGVSGPIIWKMHGVGRKHFEIIRDFLIAASMGEESGQSIPKPSVVFDELPNIHPNELHFSERIKTCLAREGITSIRELAGKPRCFFENIYGLGEKSIAEIFELLGALQLDTEGSPLSSGQLKPCDETAAATFVSDLRQLIAKEDAWGGTAVIQRFGLGSKVKTLQEVGDQVGVTRERIRQVVSRFETKCRAPNGPFSLAELALDAVFEERRLPVHVGSLHMEHEYFSDVQEFGSEFPFFVNNYLHGYRSVQLLGSWFLINIDRVKWEQVSEICSHLVSDLDKSETFLDEFESQLQLVLEHYDISSIFLPLKESLIEDLFVIPTSDGRSKLLGKSGSKFGAARSILESEPEPLHFTEIAERFRALTGKKVSDRSVHAALPRVGGILLDRGTFGTEKHISVDKAYWPSIRDFVCDRVEADLSRQWNAGNLVNVCVGRWQELEGKLNPYVLNYILDSDKRLKYLGRNIWVSVHSDKSVQRARKEVAAVVEKALIELGGPSSPREIRAKVLEYRGVGPNFQLRASERVVPIDFGLWGLIPRDVKPDVPLHQIVSSFYDLAIKCSGLVSREETDSFVNSNSFGRNVTSHVVMAIAGLDPRFYPPTDGGIQLKEEKS